MLAFLILKHFYLLIHDDMELVLFLEGHFKLKFPLMFVDDPMSSCSLNKVKDPFGCSALKGRESCLD